jgi:anti-sigma B factor antagonist
VNDDLVLEVSEEGPSVRLAVEGEIDMAAAPRLRDFLLCAGEVYDHHVIALDLSGVTFLDSSGLAVMVQAHQRLCGGRSHLVVMNPTPTVAKVIALTGLDSFLDVRTSV